MACILLKWPCTEKAIQLIRGDFANRLYVIRDKVFLSIMSGQNGRRENVILNVLISQFVLKKYYLR